jgi:hypothetical protein
MNRYFHEFVSQCPNNGKFINYSVKICVPSTRRIFVEHVVTHAALHAKDFHEDIADSFYERFGGIQTVTAFHHGVQIVTTRGDMEDLDITIPERITMGKLVYERGVTLSAVIDSLRKACKLK